MDHVAEEDGQGADEEADANGEEHDQHEAHDKPQDVDGRHHAIEDHDDGDGDEAEGKVDGRREDLLDREDPTVHLDLLQERRGVDDGAQAAVGGVVHEGEGDVAHDEVERVVLQVGAQEVLEDEAHDDHHEQRVEDAPDDAQDAPAVAELEVLGDELLKDVAVLGEAAAHVHLGGNGGSLGVLIQDFPPNADARARQV